MAKAKTMGSGAASIHNTSVFHKHSIMLSKHLSVVLLNAATFASMPHAASAALNATAPRVSTIKSLMSDADKDTKNFHPVSLGENSALINVVPNAIDDIDLEEIRASLSLKDASFSLGPYKQKLISSIYMNPSVSARLRELVGGLPVGGNEKAKVMIVKDKPSPIHIDGKFDETTNQYIPMTSNDRSALFVVDVVGDAQFRHADGSIPLDAGMFIHFRGDLEHYTHLNKGSAVTYLGPFYVNAFAKVDRSLAGGNTGAVCFGLCAIANMICSTHEISFGAEITQALRVRQLEEGANDNSTATELEGVVVMGNLVDKNTNEFASNFVAKHVTGGLPQNCINCAMNVAITNSEECTVEVHDKAMIIPLDQQLIYSTDEFGSTQGWQRQAVRELQDTNSTIPISLAELINQAASMATAALEAFTDYHVAVYLYDANGELVACSNLKALDEGTAAEYEKLLNAFIETEEAGPMDIASESTEEAAPMDTASGCNGMFVSAITIAAVGISLVLGVFTL